MTKQRIAELLSDAKGARPFHRIYGDDIIALCDLALANLETQEWLNHRMNDEGFGAWTPKVLEPLRRGGSGRR